MKSKQVESKENCFFRDSFRIEKNNINKEARTVSLSFSSETKEVQRWFGVEILDHGKGSVRLDKLNNKAPLLVDHWGQQIGVIESAEIGSDKKGRAVVRFSKGTLGEEFFQDILDEIRTKVSVGYRIYKKHLEEKDGVSIYRVTDWEPYEISMVSVPADDSVGIGRDMVNSDKNNERDVGMAKDENTEQRKTDVNIEAATHQAREEAREEARSAEQLRVQEIMAIGEKFRMRDLATEFVGSGRSKDEFRAAVLEKMGLIKPVADPSPDIGMTEKETRNFSITRAIMAKANGSWKGAELEKEASDATAQKLGRQPQGFFVPNDVITETRALNVASDGANLIATNLLASSFIDLLVNRMLVKRLGATFLDGLIGDIAIPKQTGGSTQYWVADGVAPAASQLSTSQIPLVPKTVGAFSDMTRKMLMQSTPAIEGLVRVDLARTMALELDRAAINGLGAASGQPLGILGTTGIGNVIGGTNGAAPTYANIVQLWTDVAKSNADFGATGFLTNSTMVGKLMTVEKATNTAQFIINTGLPNPEGFANMLGTRCGVSEQVPSTLTKGTSTDCSAIIYGNWNDLIIGQWGALDMLVDPYTGGTAGTLRIRVLQDIDVAVRHPESFAAMLDARNI